MKNRHRLSKTIQDSKRRDRHKSISKIEISRKTSFLPVALGAGKPANLRSGMGRPINLRFGAGKPANLRSGPGKSVNLRSEPELRIGIVRLIVSFMDEPNKSKESGVAITVTPEPDMDHYSWIRWSAASFTMSPTPLRIIVGW